MKPVNPRKQVINTAELTAILQGIRGAKIATVVIETQPELKKRNNPLQNVTKKVTMNILFNFNYRAALDKALIANGKAPSNRPAGRRTWGQRVPNSPFIMHKGALYLEVKNNGRPSKVEWFANGNPLAYDAVAPFLPAAKQMEVPMCDIKIQNILELRVNGTQYTIQN